MFLPSQKRTDEWWGFFLFFFFFPLKIAELFIVVSELYEAIKNPMAEDQILCPYIAVFNVYKFHS